MFLCHYFDFRHVEKRRSVKNSMVKLPCCFLSVGQGFRKAAEAPAEEAPKAEEAAPAAE